MPNDFFELVKTGNQKLKYFLNMYNEDDSKKADFIIKNSEPLIYFLHDSKVHNLMYKNIEEEYMGTRKTELITTLKKLVESENSKLKIISDFSPNKADENTATFEKIAEFKQFLKTYQKEIKRLEKMLSFYIDKPENNEHEAIDLYLRQTRDNKKKENEVISSVISHSSNMNIVSCLKKLLKENSTEIDNINLFLTNHNVNVNSFLNQIKAKSNNSDKKERFSEFLELYNRKVANIIEERIKTLLNEIKNLKNNIENTGREKELELSSEELYIQTTIYKDTKMYSHKYIKEILDEIIFNINTEDEQNEQQNVQIEASILELLEMINKINIKDIAKEISPSPILTYRKFIIQKYKLEREQELKNIVINIKEIVTNGNKKAEEFLNIANTEYKNKAIQQEKLIGFLCDKNNKEILTNYLACLSPQNELKIYEKFVNKLTELKSYQAKALDDFFSTIEEKRHDLHYKKIIEPKENVFLGNEDLREFIENREEEEESSEDSNNSTAFSKLASQSFPNNRSASVNGISQPQNVQSEDRDKKIKLDSINSTAFSKRESQSFPNNRLAFIEQPRQSFPNNRSASANRARQGLNATDSLGFIKQPSQPLNDNNRSAFIEQPSQPLNANNSIPFADYTSQYLNTNNGLASANRISQPQNVQSEDREQFNKKTNLDSNNSTAFSELASQSFPNNRSAFIKQPSQPFPNNRSASVNKATQTLNANDRAAMQPQFSKKLENIIEELKVLRANVLKYGDRVNLINARAILKDILVRHDKLLIKVNKYLSEKKFDPDPEELRKFKSFIYDASKVITNIEKILDEISQSKMDDNNNIEKEIEKIEKIEKIKKDVECILKNEKNNPNDAIEKIKFVNKNLQLIRENILQYKDSLEINPKLKLSYYIDSYLNIDELFKEYVKKTIMPKLENEEKYELKKAVINTNKTREALDDIVTKILKNKKVEIKSNFNKINSIDYIDEKVKTINNILMQYKNSPNLYYEAINENASDNALKYQDILLGLRRLAANLNDNIKIERLNKIINTSLDLALKIDSDSEGYYTKHVKEVAAKLKEKDEGKNIELKLFFIDEKLNKIKSRLLSSISSLCLHNDSVFRVFERNMATYLQIKELVETYFKEIKIFEDKNYNDEQLKILSDFIKKINNDIIDIKEKVRGVILNNTDSNKKINKIQDLKMEKNEILNPKLKSDSASKLEDISIKLVIKNADEESERRRRRHSVKGVKEKRNLNFNISCLD